MYALLQSTSMRQLITEQIPTMLGALIIAELFYKFHSFMLEALAFLATWYLLDFGVRRIQRLLGWR